MIATILDSAIHHDVSGDGPAIVFVHGLGGTSNVWHGQRVLLQKTYRVVTLDLPGSGRSGKDESRYSLDRWADQIVGLADYLKIDRFVLVGHSMGTIIGQKAAAKFPERVEGLVLCGPATEMAPAAKETFRKRKELALSDEGMAAVADLVLAGALTTATREGNLVLAGLFREMLMGNTARCYAAQIDALIEGSARAAQPKIECPTLILVGDQDVVTPLSDARVIASVVKKSRLRIIPATAHLTMSERPDFFNHCLLEFLSELRS